MEIPRKTVGFMIYGVKLAINIIHKYDMLNIFIYI